jgi:hypothetical protein
MQNLATHLNVSDDKKMNKSSKIVSTMVCASDFYPNRKSAQPEADPPLAEIHQNLKTCPERM